MEETDNFIIDTNKPQIEEVIPEAIEAEAPKEEEIATSPNEETPAEVNEASTVRVKNRTQKRIESLVTDKHTLERKVKELEAQLQEKIDPQDYETQEDYIAARDSVKTVQHNDSNLVVEQLKDKFMEASEKYSDFDKKITDDNLMLTVALMNVINESDDAGEVAYYLASNPKETARIANLSPAKMTLEVDKIESKLKTKQTETPVVIPKKVTQAADPITPSGGTNGMPKTLESTSSLKEYEAMRRDTSRSGNGFV